MNIGFFSDVYRPGIDGIVTALDMFLIESKKLGHNTYIVTPRYPGYSDENTPQVGQVIRVPSIPFLFYPPYRIGLPGLSKKTYLRLESLKLEIIHTHSPFSVGLYGVHLARKWNLPLLYTYHTLYPKYVHYFFKGKIISSEGAAKIVRNYSDKCDCVIAPSPQMRDELLSYGVKTRVVVLPTGVNKDDFTARDLFSVRQKHNLGTSTKILLYAGRLGKEKNLYLLLGAFRKVLKEMPDTVLFLAGDGILKDELKSISKSRGIADKTIFLNFLDRQTLAQYYKEADLFVFPSVTETQGLVLIEVMMNKTAVLTMNQGGVLSIVRHNENGILSDNSEDEFARWIIKILKDDALRKRLEEAGYRSALEMTSEISTKKHIELYRDLLSSPKYKK
jgi:1,2-diacylglycerol 3-alpha-glucosyltransferase